MRTRSIPPRALMRAALLVFLLTASLISPARAETVSAEVTVGKSILLDVSTPVKRVSIADPSIADVVAVSPTELQINGKKSGITTMIVWDETGLKTFFDLNVLNARPVFRDFTTLIKKIAPNDVVGYTWLNDETLIVTGTVKTDERKEKIRNILLGFGKDATIQEIKELLSKGMEIKLTSTQQVGSQSDAGADTQSEKSYDDEKKNRFVLLLEVSEPPQILLKVTVASIDRKATRELGINWSYSSKYITIDSAVSSLTGGITKIEGLLQGVKSGGLTTEGINGATFSVVDWHNGVQYLLRALATKGLAKIYAEPNLIVCSGKTGSFLAGSEVPLPVVQSIGTGANAITIEFKKVGVIMEFKPKIQEDGLIRLGMIAEVSSVAESLVTVNNIKLPTFATNSIGTSVDLKEGQAFVVAGLINNEWSKNLTKLPGLGDIPILGAFFRTQTVEKKETELMFFITPRLVAPLDKDGPRPAVPGAEEPAKGQDDYLRWIPTMPSDITLDPERLK